MNEGNGQYELGRPIAMGFCAAVAGYGLGWPMISYMAVGIFGWLLGTQIRGSGS